MTSNGTPERRLDRKLASINSGSYTADDFIIADAKDADMAFGSASAGPVTGPASTERGPGVHRSRETYLDNMRTLLDNDALDILLTSASNGERIAPELDADVTLAVRGNDTTDCWNQYGSSYTSQPARPWRTANLSDVRAFCDLVLYAVTFNNDLERDLEAVAKFAEFREEAAEVGMRYFLEVFNPNAPVGLDPKDVGWFVNDSILRTLAGVTVAKRPLFLKMPYNGTAAVAELAEYDPSVVIGILGGSAGTTRDTFELLHRAEQAGARVALFGRKIQRAESQLDLVTLMRPVLRGELSPADGVRAYHDALAKADITPYRTLEDDLQVTDKALLSE